MERRASGRDCGCEKKRGGRKRGGWFKEREGGLEEGRERRRETGRQAATKGKIEETDGRTMDREDGRKEGNAKDRGNGDLSREFAGQQPRPPAPLPTGMTVAGLDLYASAQARLLLRPHLCCWYLGVCAQARP